MSSFVSRNLDLMRRLHDLVREHPDFEVLLQPTKYLYCFRYVPNALSERQEDHDIQCKLDDLNQEIVAAVQNSGCALVTATRICGRIGMRMSICVPEMSEADVDATFESIARCGRLLSRSSEVHNEKESCHV
jgi:glutamate/tyrosine decarboxylase-like PLP-dependent enzyme